MKITPLVLSLTLSTFLGACSTITTGTTQNFTIETEETSGANCTLTDNKGAIYKISDTPGTTQVSKGDGPMTIRCEKTGYKTATKIVQEGFAGATLGNILIGGGIGFVVDAASGAAQKYPDKVVIWLEPNAFSSPAEKAEWEASKAAYEESIKPASQKQEVQTKSTGNFNNK